MLRHVFSVMTFIALTGCAATSTETPTNNTAQPLKQTASVSADTTVQVTLVQERLTIDEAAGTATLAPNDRRKSAVYTRWIFDLASFKKTVTLPLTQPTRVRAVIISTHTATHKPDPRMPQPDGGFKHVTHRARIQSLAP